MAFIEPEDKTELVELKVKIRPELKADLERYCKDELNNSSLQHGVGAILRKVMDLEQAKKTKQNVGTKAKSGKAKASQFAA